MKNILIAGIFSLLTSPLFAQKIIEKEFNLPASGRVTLELKFGELIKISTWESNKVAFKASIDLNNGLLNDSLKHEFIEGETLNIKSDIPQGFNNWMSKKYYDSENENIRYWTGNEEGIIISEIYYELKVPKNCLIKINSINADVEIRNLLQSMDIKTINGFVDANWSDKVTADFELKTINGEVYSDIDDLKFLNKKENPIVGYNLKAQLGNSNNKKVKLHTINGDVFLRKSDNI